MIAHCSAAYDAIRRYRNTGRRAGPEFVLGARERLRTIDDSRVRDYVGEAHAFFDGTRDWSLLRTAANHSTHSPVSVYSIH